MAEEVTLTEAQQKDWDEWVATRPEAVQSVANRLPPWHLYRVVSTDQRATVQSYDEDEDGTITVSVEVWREWLPIRHGVFGMSPDDLEILEPFALITNNDDADDDA